MPAHRYIHFALLLSCIALGSCYLDLDTEKYPYPGDPVVVVDEPNSSAGCADNCFRRDFCDGTTAVSHEGLGTCDTRSQTCDFSRVEEREDCAASDLICVDGSCRSEPCENVDCPARAATCDGSTRVSDAGPGMCDGATGRCSYEAVIVREDCPGECENGVCLGSSWSMGDLLISEVMFDPATVVEREGEWFEVVNVSGRTMDLNGLLISDGEASFQVTQAFVLEADEFAVLAYDDDPAKNGDVAVDFAYGLLASGFQLANAMGDQISIKDGSTVIVELDFSQPAFPLDGGEGRSLQLDVTAVADRDAQASRWCTATESFGSQDGFGTPGTTNSPCL